MAQLLVEDPAHRILSFWDPRSWIMLRDWTMPMGRTMPRGWTMSRRWTMPRVWTMPGGGLDHAERLDHAGWGGWTMPRGWTTPGGWIMPRDWTMSSGLPRESWLCQMEAYLKGICMTDLAFTWAMVRTSVFTIFFARDPNIGFSNGNYQKMSIRTW